MILQSIEGMKKTIIQSIEGMKRNIGASRLENFALGGLELKIAFTRIVAIVFE